MAGRDHNAVEAAAAELRAFGIEGIFAGIERGEAIGAISRRGGAQLFAGGSVAQDNADTGERGGVEIGQAAGERARRCWRRLPGQGHSCHQTQRHHGKESTPNTPFRSHVQPAAHAKRENMRPCAPGARPRRCHFEHAQKGAFNNSPACAHPLGSWQRFYARFGAREKMVAEIFFSAAAGGARGAAPAALG